MNTVAFTINALLLLLSFTWNMFDRIKSNKEKPHGPYFTFQPRTDERYEEPQSTYPEEMNLPQEEDIPLYDYPSLTTSGYQGPIVRADNIQGHPYFVVSNIEVRFQSIDKKIQAINKMVDLESEMISRRLESMNDFKEQIRLQVKNT